MSDPEGTWCYCFTLLPLYYPLCENLSACKAYFVLLTIVAIKSMLLSMNVVPRNTGNTNSGTRELTLKCKFKCYINP